MEWVASTLHTTSELRVSIITTADAHTSADAPADLNGIVLFAERRNLVSAHVPSHFKRSIHQEGKCSRSFRSALYNSDTGSTFRLQRSFREAR
jgi:hypothetical protein